MNQDVFGRYSVAIVTPFISADVDPSQPVDLDGFRCLIDRLCRELSILRSSSNSCIGGIIVTGSTGEQHSLSVEERKLLYREAVCVADHFGVPIAAGNWLPCPLLPYGLTILLSSASVAAYCKQALLPLLLSRL